MQRTYELPNLGPVSLDNVDVSMSPTALDTLIYPEWYIYEEEKAIQIDISYDGEDGLNAFADLNEATALVIHVAGEGGDDYQIPIEVEKNDGLPYLMPEPFAVYEYGTEDSITIDLGFPLDWDGEDAEIDVVFNDGSDDFMYYDSEYFMIFNYEGDDISAGTYTIVVTVTGAFNAVEYEI